MTAPALIEEAQADGLELLPNGDKLKLRGPADVVVRWKPRIAAHKATILAVLSATAPVDRDASPNEENSPATASRWWLLHYRDRNPAEVASFPPVTHADILERHPDAIAAEPINQAAPEPGRKSCSTCAHVTGRGGCGEPVVAGLSDVVGVIFYSPDQGATCPAWLVRLDTDLEVAIRAMAERWDYSADDLATALAGARVAPEGWWRVVDADEAFEERAAIMEYDGGLSREEAQRQAAENIVRKG